MKVVLYSGAILALLVTVAAVAGNSDDQEAPRSVSEAEIRKISTLSGWERFKRAHGEDWTVRWRPDTALPLLVFGQKTVAPTSPPSGDEDFEMIARSFLDDHSDFFGTQNQNLRTKGVNFSDLSAIGTSSKVGVQFEQVIKGVPVHGAWVTVLMHLDGSIIAVHTDIYPDAADLQTQPRLTEQLAHQIAQDDLASRHAVANLEVRESQFVIKPIEQEGAIESHLGWLISVGSFSKDTSVVPTFERLFVDASSGEVLTRQNLVCDADLLGSIEANATPGTLPDSGSNPETPMPLPDLEVTASGLGTTNTDDFGDFVFSSVSSGTYNVSADLEGPYCHVFNQAGSDASVSEDVQTDTPETLTFNTSLAEERTAEVNSYIWVLKMRKWMLSIDPSYDLTNFQIRSNVNLNNNCNAFFDGSSINFYTSGGGCVNTAYSTVVAHEEGHWLNVLAGSGNGSDGFGEGGADIWAIFLTDDNIVGEDFCGSGCHIRDGNNTRQFCGDNNPGCHGGVHANGEVLMGAFWKWRTNLNNTYGDAAGDAIADALMIAWFKQYDDGQIRTFVRDHILILDDDDGNVNNGTPNFNDIDNGFVAQGFPAFDLQAISIFHTPLDDTNDQVGPYPVVADVVSNVSSTITAATLFYDVGSGFVSVPMTSTGNPDEFTADIPGQPAPSTINYYISADDNQGNSQSDPDNAPSVTYSFGIGDRGAPFFFDGFETDIGWTHAGSGQDDWQRGTPQGKVEDPDFAYSGSNAWANDLGLSGWNGAYSNNVDNTLTSPSIDCTGELGVRLEFQRWLAIEEATWDQARVEVSINGGAFQQVWVNPTGQNLIDTSWQFQTVDISSLADNQSDVRLRFHLTTDTSVTFGGWNIDEVALTSLAPPDDAVPPDAPTDLSSPSHQINVWNANTTIDATWTAANDDDSGVDGYSVLWDQSASTTPDTVKDLEETDTSYSESVSSSNGGWYFHIRTVDNAGNWGDAVHLGPMLVDATAPDAPTDLDSSTHNVGQWSQDTSVDVSWTPAIDTIGSGVDGYSFVWDQNSNTTPDTTKDAEEGATSDSTTVSSSDDGYYFHIRTVDNVGNWGPAVHFGPILVDNVNPDAPTDLDSSSHTVGQWDTNTSVTATWTPAVDPTGAGLAGYSVVWDQDSGTVPDETQDLTDSDTEDTATLASSPNGHYFHIRAVDGAGNWGDTVHLGPFLIDANAPGGSIVVDADAPSTGDLLVTIDLSGTDSESGLGAGATMRFSNDGVSYSAEEPYASTKSGWDLASFGGDSEPGAKTVYAIIRDVAGNESTVLTDGIDFEPLPTIETIAPASGSSDGGTEVTITGTGFTPSTAVSFDGFDAASVTYVNSTTLIVETPPAHPIQFVRLNLMFLPVDVSVTTTGGTATEPNGFTYTRF